MRAFFRRRDASLAALLAVTAAGVWCVNPAFASLANVRDILVNAAPAAIVACGMMLVIVSGEIDISVGSMMGLLAAVLGLLASTNRLGWPAPAAAAAVVALGALLGLVNGALVAVCGAPSIIVTLGMLSALRGATELLMGGEWITDLPAGLRFLGVGSVAGVPVCLWAAAGAAVFTGVLARRTALGLRIYAVGSSPAAARLAGLSAARVKLFVFMLSGLLTGVATVVTAPQLSVVEAGFGQGFELLVITCVVVGGVSIQGGVGRLSGVLLGVLLLTMVRTVLIYLRLGESATYWERAVQGAFILAAVLADHLAARRAPGEATR